MKRNKPRRMIKHLQRGVLSWAPILVMPFALLFCEVWLQLHIYQNDYEKARLTGEIRELQERIDGLQARQADLEAFDRLESYIPELEMVAPERSQITVIPYRYIEGDGRERGLAYAQLEQERPAEAAVHAESR
jgi:hypothetical protein